MCQARLLLLLLFKSQLQSCALHCAPGDANHDGGGEQVGAADDTNYALQCLERLHSYYIATHAQLLKDSRYDTRINKQPTGGSR